MAYITVADLQKRFGEDEILALADRDGDDIVDTDVIDQAIADVAAVIDVYLSGRYQVPLESPPTIVQSIAADLVRFKLMDNRATEEAEKRYKDAIQLLRDIAASRASLPVAEVSANNAALPVGKKTDSDRIFSASTLEGF